MQRSKPKNVTSFFVAIGMMIASIGVGTASASPQNPEPNPNVSVVTTSAIAAFSSPKITTREAAGHYYHLCTFAARQHPWNPPAIPANCPGWLDTYISGQLVSHIDMAKVADVVSTAPPTNQVISGKCIISAGWVIVGLVVPGVGWVRVGKAARAFSLGSLGVATLTC